MAITPLWKITNTKGELIYSGEAVTRRALLASLFEQGASFAGANLGGYDLSHMNLNGIDLTGANLAGAVLRGATANKARFDHANLDGVRAEGLTARQASFRHARLGLGERKNQCATFDGAILTHSCFDGAEISGASFEGISASGVTFDLAKLLRVRFANAVLSNADWSRAEVLQCDFSHAELNASSGALKVPRASLPNRTIDTVAIGNTYSGAVLDASVPKLSFDRAATGVANHIAWAASTAAILAATAALPVDPTGEWLGKLVGQGTVMLGAVALITLIKEKIDEKLQHQLADVTLKLQGMVRGAFAELTQRGANIAETVAALTRGPGLKPLRKALAATHDGAQRNGIFNEVKQLVLGSTNIILCDRRHMALALEWMSSSYGRTRLLKRDFIVSRVAHDNDSAPTMLKFFADGGGMAAFWTKDGKMFRAMGWDADELVPEAWPVNGPAPAHSNRTMPAMRARQLFEQAVVNDHFPSVRLTYDRLTHQLRAGRDGSIVVTRQRDQLARNAHGPVLIRGDGSALSEKEAVALSRRDDDDAAPATRAM